MELKNQTAKEFKKFTLETISRRVLCKKNAEGRFFPVIDGKEATAILLLEMDFQDFWLNAKVVAQDETAAEVAKMAVKKEMRKRKKVAAEKKELSFTPKEVSKAA